jgi:cytochrome c-type biogenesis protein CcmF
MKKPHVEKFLTYDFYLSPLAMEQPQDNDPGNLILQKGETGTVGRYEITFHDFELDSHGEMEVSKVTALLTVNYDDKTEEIKPSLEVQGSSVQPFAASFDYDKGTVFVTGVQPDDGSVILKVSGDFLPPPDIQQTSLVVELSEKPLINLFWLGCIIVFLSGFLSMRERRRRKRLTLTDERTSVDRPEKQLVQ